MKEVAAKTAAKIAAKTAGKVGSAKSLRLTLIYDLFFPSSQSEVKARARSQQQRMKDRAKVNFSM